MGIRPEPRLSRSGAPLVQAMADLWEHDPQFVVESRRHQQQQDEQALAALEQQATENAYEPSHSIRWRPRPGPAVD